MRPAVGADAVLVDYGGVLTTPLDGSRLRFCRTEGIEPDDLDAVLGEWLGTADTPAVENSPAHAVERGELSLAEFERLLAAHLRTREGRHPRADGLTTRLFAQLRPDRTMVRAVRQLRDAGVRTAVVSNSWGLNYPRQEWHGLFDAVLLSAEIGVRKPEPEIYLEAARRVRTTPARCVFIDDRPSNVIGARNVGMAGITHRSTRRTLARLEALLGLTLH
jgi:putative hydrolase of the HAD superfamily